VKDKESTENRTEQGAVGDDRLRRRCCHMATWTKSTKSTSILGFVLFHPIYDNVTSSTKPEIHNISHCRQKRTEPRPRVRCTENWVKLACVRFASRQTDIQTDTLIAILGTSTEGKVKITTAHGMYVISQWVVAKVMRNGKF